MVTKNEKIRILLLENIHPVAVERLREEGFEVTTEGASLSEEDLINIISQFQVIGIRSKTNLTKKIMDQSKNLLAVGAFCIGTNQIDLVTANKNGTPVFNAPYSNTRSVAEMVIAEMIILARNIGDRSMQVHHGQWNKSATGCHEVRGKTLGIIGYGHIGSQLSILAEALGLRVLYYDVIKKLPLGNARPVSNLNELLKESDFISLHVPETHQTKNMISKKELEMFKPGAFLINASRGSVVDIQALAATIKDGKLGGAAVDVFPEEPKSNSEEFVSELRGLANVILTPHIGGSTEEAQEAIGREVAESFIKFLKNGSTRGAVNFPNVDLPPLDKVSRILNVHKNVPGVLKDINEIVASTGANIHAQYLSTDADIGYMVMDLEEKSAIEITERISKLKTNIRTRLV